MKNKKKVSILSMQNVNNFGSLLQSYSLKKILNNLNCDVSFLNIESNPEDNKLIQNGKDYSTEIDKYSESVLMRKLMKIDRYALIRVKNKIKNRTQNSIFQEFRVNNLNIVGNENDKIYDLCVIGSDEVFNCMQPSVWGFTTQLFGNVEQASEVISYAASCGFTIVDQIPLKARERISENLKSLKAISVRDHNTFHFVDELTGIKPELNLDPVIVGDFSEEMDKARLNYTAPKEDYCVIYAYENRIKNPEEINVIKDFCKKNKLKIIAAGAPQKWISHYEVVDPFELLILFENAKFVITDTFHGTIFSFKFSNKFATILRESNTEKLKDLMYRLNIEDHLLHNIHQLDQIYKLNKDEDKMNMIYQRERNKTIKYLEENL